MNRLHSAFKKYLMSQPFFEDGFEYQFISVESIEDSSLVFTVNVLLPKKGQSFVVETFSYGIMRILNIASKNVDLPEPFAPKKRLIELKESSKFTRERKLSM